jgi:guanyl-specific ribonuclease Sa
MKPFRQILALLAAFIMLAGTGMADTAASAAQTITVDAGNYIVVEGGSYTSMEEVAVYLSIFGALPANYITKNTAQALGWDNRLGNLHEVAPGKSIGGNRFGNYEGQLPGAKGRVWTECDIDADGHYRNAKRIAFSNDGLIYYSDDHYNTFRQVLVTQTVAAPAQGSADIREDGAYLGKDDVAMYLHLYGKLPYNYLTRNEAKKLGWTSQKDNLGALAPGYAIGGDSFGNREGLLPNADGRVWHECDVNGQNGERSGQRLVWSNDGLIYFTPDGHKSFIRLY